MTLNDQMTVKTFSGGNSWIRAFECQKNNTTSAIPRCSVHCTVS